MKARKDHECVTCLSIIEEGEEYQKMTAVFDGELSSRGWCIGCCMAAALYVVSDNPREIEAREIIRSHNEKTRAPAAKKARPHAE